MTGGTEVIKLIGISKTYYNKDTAVEAIKDINLHIEKGDIFGIIGLSGAGKSTLVRCKNYLEKPTAGEVVFDGQVLGALSHKELLKARQSISMIFQGFNLLEQRTALKNVCYPLEIMGVKKEDAKKRAMELLEIVGLADKASAYPSKLSGGQKQRVAIAGVLAMKPDCIVLDEPTAMLDPSGRKEVIDTIKRLNKEEGITIILITHYMDETVDADRIIVMDKGKVAITGTPEEIFSQVDMIKGFGLDVPQVTEVCNNLRKMGIDLPADILTVDEMVKEICRLKSTI